MHNPLLICAVVFVIIVALVQGDLTPLHTHSVRHISREEFESRPTQNIVDVEECEMEDDEMRHHHAMSSKYGTRRHLSPQFAKRGLVDNKTPPPLFSHLYENSERSHAKPKCALTQCGNPAVRDLYSKPSKTYRIKIDWLYTTASDHYKNAIKTVETMTHLLNRVYKNTGFVFQSNVLVFDMNDELAKRLGFESAEQLRDFRVHKYNCADREDGPEDARRYACVESEKLIKAIRGPNWNSLGAFQLLPVEFTRVVLNGFGKFPWDPLHGLLVISHRALVKGATTLPHEMGHCLGLLHTFSGYETDRCNACSEHSPNGDDFTGDLISDTPPMPKWHPMTSANTCNELPDPQQYPNTCGQSWNNTPNLNIMSYGTCRNSLTPQQGNRIRCFVDRVLKKKFWVEEPLHVQKQFDA